MLRNGGWRTASDETWEIVIEALPVKKCKVYRKTCEVYQKNRLDLP